MKPFGWIQPVAVAPAELMVSIALWQAAGAALSALVVWLVKGLLAIEAFSEPSLISFLLVLLWLVAALVVHLCFERLTTWWALAALALLSLLVGLLFASLFPLHVALIWFAIIGGMYLLSAAIARGFGSRLSAGGFYWLMALLGISLALAVNSLYDSNVLLWIASILAVLVLSMVSAQQSKVISFSARQLYAREFTTVQSSAIRGALAVRLGVINAIFNLLELLYSVLSAFHSR